MDVLSVAGFIAPADVWSDFEIKWNRKLSVNRDSQKENFLAH
jgi:hypothetical protein